MFRHLPCCLLLAGILGRLGAAGLEPPRGGVRLTGEERTELTAGWRALAGELAQFRRSGDPRWSARWPDVEIFVKAVGWALVHEEFQAAPDVAEARRLLARGRERLAALQAGSAPWLEAPGLSVRGFVSRLDDSVQPYGVVRPAGWERGGRVDVWLAGRDEQRTELRFLRDRLKSAGEFAPVGALVIHPYGRFCNAYKFAGETDVLEALEHALAEYGGDRGRLAVRGFSMGGAGTWHLAVHHPGRWRAAAPGAGFAETAEYTGILAREPDLPWYEQKLWRWYDAPPYAANLRQVPLLAYSGERDRQIQAARVMERAAQAEGVTFPHLIGPGVEHRYEPETKQELARRFDAWMSTPAPALPTLDLVTCTLRYPAGEGRVWARFEGLTRHWEPARIRAAVREDGRLEVSTAGVTALSLGAVPGWTADRVNVHVDGQRVAGGRPPREAAGRVWLVKTDRGWQTAGPGATAGQKRPGLQGPIDDAFLDSFLVVTPGGRAAHPAVGTWVDHSWRQFTNQWRAQFRGAVRCKPDREVTEADLRSHHLVLWGDPDSNRLLARMQRRLPVSWDRAEVRVGDRRYPAGRHVPVLIAPNPLHPERYVVVNAGHTFADWNGTNARQTPRLPDWAVLELTNGPARVVAADFFDENWRVPGRRPANH
ncbi:MAG: prolyl oligopeptidase family serine peptidase [Verrucomicrobiota bacterium]